MICFIDYLLRNWYFFDNINNKLDEELVVELKLMEESDVICINIFFQSLNNILFQWVNLSGICRLICWLFLRVYCCWYVCDFLDDGDILSLQVFYLSGSFFLFVIKKHECIFRSWGFILCSPIAIFLSSTISLLWQLWDIKLWNSRIIKFKPCVWSHLDNTVVMACCGCPWMNYNSFELIFTISLIGCSLIVLDSYIFT